MKKISLWTIITILCISLTVVFSFAGCASATAPVAEEPVVEEPAVEEPVVEEPAEVAEQEWEIVDVPKLAPTPYFDRGAEGLVLASEKFGINAYQIGVIDFDPSAQIAIIEDLIARDVDAILACAIDPDSLVPVLKRAMDAGILTMAYSSPVSEEAITWDVRSLDDEAFGRHIWDLLVENMGDSGDYAVLTGQIDTPDHTLWFYAGKEYAEEKYPDLNLVTERIPTDEKLEVAYDTTIDLLSTYPDLKGMIGLGAGNPPGIAKAIRDRGLIGEIAVVGTSLPQMSAEYLKDGSLNVATLWDPLWISYVTAYIAKLELEGQEIYDGMEVPGYDAQLKVDGKIIIPGPWTDFIAENVDEFLF